jgi:hypothetical protein
MGWVTKLDDTFWSSYSGATWSGTEWDATGLLTNDVLGLQAIGGWNTGYRPINLRLTISASIAIDLDVIVNPGGSQENLGTIHVTTTPTAFTFPLDFAWGGDIHYLETDPTTGASSTPWSQTWHNIEFEEAGPPPVFWENFVKTTETDS